MWFNFLFFCMYDCFCCLCYLILVFERLVYDDKYRERVYYMKNFLVVINMLRFLKILKGFSF